MIYREIQVQGSLSFYNFLFLSSYSQRCFPLNISEPFVSPFSCTSHQHMWLTRKNQVPNKIPLTIQFNLLPASTQFYCCKGFGWQYRLWTVHNICILQSTIARMVNKNEKITLLLGCLQNCYNRHLRRWKCPPCSACRFPAPSSSPRFPSWPSSTILLSKIF